MNVFEAIKNRFSVRSYKSNPVSQEKLEKILEAVRLAPSAHNSQNWKFIVVKSEEQKAELAKAATQDFINQAPIIIVGVATDADQLMTSGVPAGAVNLSIASTHLILEATEEGLGTCWVGAFDQEKVKKILNIPAEKKYQVVALIPLGYSAENPSKKIRKKLKEIICNEKFNK